METKTTATRWWRFGRGAVTAGVLALTAIGCAGTADEGGTDEPAEATEQAQTISGCTNQTTLDTYCNAYGYCTVRTIAKVYCTSTPYGYTHVYGQLRRSGGEMANCNRKCYAHSCSCATAWVYNPPGSQRWDGDGAVTTNEYSYIDFAPVTRYY